jgi:ferredoxin
VPKLEVQGYGAFEVPNGARLVGAIESNGVDILHRCGGCARCTTCRVEFIEGEPERMTVAEQISWRRKGCWARFVSRARSSVITISVSAVDLRR